MPDFSQLQILRETRGKILPTGCPHLWLYKLNHHNPSRHGSARSRTKTPALLQLEALSEHLLRASPQKRAAKHSWSSARFCRHVNSIPFRGHVCIHVQMCSWNISTRSYKIIVLHHLHSFAFHERWYGAQKKSRKCQPLLDARVFPTTNPKRNKRKNSTNGMSPPLTLQNKSSQPKSEWVGPFPNQDTGATSAWGAVWTPSAGFSSEAGCQR